MPNDSRPHPISFYINFNIIIITSTARCPKLSFSFSVSEQSTSCISHLFQACYLPRPTLLFQLWGNITETNGNKLKLSRWADRQINKYRQYTNFINPLLIKNIIFKICSGSWAVRPQELHDQILFWACACYSCSSLRCPVMAEATSELVTISYSVKCLIFLHIDSPLIAAQNLCWKPNKNYIMHTGHKRLHYKGVWFMNKQ